MMGQAKTEEKKNYNNAETRSERNHKRTRRKKRRNSERNIDDRKKFEKIKSSEMIAFLCRLQNNRVFPVFVTAVCCF
jgi:hypothetical protein